MLPGSHRDSFNFVFNLYKCGSDKNEKKQTIEIVYSARVK